MDTLEKQALKAKHLQFSLQSSKSYAQKAELDWALLHTTSYWEIESKTKCCSYLLPFNNNDFTELCTLDELNSRKDFIYLFII